MFSSHVPPDQAVNQLLALLHPGWTPLWKAGGSERFQEKLLLECFNQSGRWSPSCKSSGSSRSIDFQPRTTFDPSMDPPKTPQTTKSPPHPMKWVNLGKAMKTLLYDLSTSCAAIMSWTGWTKGVRVGQAFSTIAIVIALWGCYSGRQKSKFTSIHYRGHYHFHFLKQWICHKNPLCKDNEQSSGLFDLDPNIGQNS